MPDPFVTLLSPLFSAFKGFLQFDDKLALAGIMCTVQHLSLVC